MFDIQVVHARQILDSRGNPTVEVEIGLSGGIVARARALGASTGEHRPPNSATAKRVYFGKGVLKAVESAITASAQPSRAWTAASSRRSIRP